MKPKNNIIQIKKIVNSVIAQLDQAEQESYIEIREKQKSADNNFEITHKEIVARAFEAVGDPIGKVEAYIVRNARMDCGLLFCSISEVSEETHASKSTVQKVFLSWQYADLLRLYKYGIWAVHPRFLRRGGSERFIVQLRFYNSLPKKEIPKKKEEEREEELTELGEKLKVLH